MNDYQLELSADASKAAAVISRAAEEWGAAWQADGDGGQLVLPVVQGLKRGAIKGRVILTADGRRTRLHLQEEESRLQLNRPALVVLLFGALGGVTAMLWPFFEGLLPLAPAGIVLALVAWFLVNSRLHSSGPRDFLQLVERIAAEETSPPAGDHT